VLVRYVILTLARSAACSRMLPTPVGERGDRVFYRALLSEDLVLVGGPETDLDQSRPVTFAQLVELPLVVAVFMPDGHAFGHIS